MRGLTYNPAVYAVRDVQQAMEIILTPEDSTTQERWRTETGYLAGMIEEQLGINPATLLLDYGCGIGRIAKELIALQDCTVVGVDTSPHMRMLAVPYVGSDRFTSCSRDTLDALLAAGLRFDAAISVWVLQHCRDPAEDIALIRAALKPGAPFFVVNNVYRAVPTVEEAWADDGIDIKAFLAEEFELQQDGRLSAEHTTANLSQATFWARFRRQQDPGG